MAHMSIFEGSHAKSEPTITPWQMQKMMGLGINMGNVLEAPREGVFAESPTAKHFEMFHDAGFANCRIPVNWGCHMMVEEPYTIDPQFLKRVAELVKYSMDHGMITIITAHHEWWIDVDDRSYQAHDDWLFKQLPRFESLWKQVAAHFASYRQLLIFGILNEPAMLKAQSLNELHQAALVAIRETNPTRIVTISGKDFANPRWLLDNPKALFIPRDPQLMLEIHVTEPHGFAGTRPTREAWGSLEDQLKTKHWIDEIEIFGRARNLPIYVGEFGCSNEQKGSDDGKSRLTWLECNWTEMRRKEFCASLWDDGDRFSVYNRATGEWDHDVLTAMQRSLPGLQGVSMYRTGGGLGADSGDPTADLQRRLELCFSRLSIAMDDVSKHPELPPHDYQTELGGARKYSDESDSD